MDTPQNKDPELWRIAQARAAFKVHLPVYLLVISGLWALWFMTGADNYGRGLPWPVWPTFGWGIGLAFHFFGAYLSTGRMTSAEREYEKLAKRSDS